MESLPTWAVWGVVVPCVLLSPAIALLLPIAIEILIGCLVDTRAPAFVVIAAGGAGLLLWQKMRAHPSRLAPAET